MMEQATKTTPTTEELVASVVEKELLGDAQSPEPNTSIPATTPVPRLPLTHRTAAKVTAFILTIILLFVTTASAFGAAIMVAEEFYIKSEAAYREDAFQSMAQGIASTVIHHIVNGQEQEALAYIQHKNIAGISVDIDYPEGTPDTRWQYGTSSHTGTQTRYEHLWYLSEHKGLYYNISTEDSNAFAPVRVTVSVPHELTQEDQFYFADKVISVAYVMRYWVFAIAIVAFILAVICFVFLLCASGRRRGLPDPQPGWGTKVPIDLLTVGTGLGIFLLLEVAFESYHYDYYANDILRIALIAAVGIASAVMVLGWCMSFALRVKLGSWWKNSICFYAVKLCWRIVKTLWRGLRAIGRGILGLLRNIPLVWKSALFLFGLALAELIALSIWYYQLDSLLVFWALKHLALIPMGLLLTLAMRRLQTGGQAIASGDLSYQVDTRRMPADFRRHGEALNSISQGMTAAVEQRLRSERMKTELITNVSHDIKTPLTSIINYADLIGKEPCDNQPIREYAEVLHRQSERLKRLIDDLVEASKASTGNLEVLLAPCEVGVLLAQTAGEYEQRLLAQQLTLVTTQPEQPLRILADGRRLWRVIDNLMSNICKYSQSGTRVYLTLEEQAGQAVITFRNTSREPLNLTADQFMERFVQGDSSRASDGNGLGLSIAKSLTELQNGIMELTVDGDLFKVMLKFPAIP